MRRSFSQWFVGRGPVFYLLVVAVAFLAFVAVLVAILPPVYDPGEGVVVVGIVNDTSAPLKIAYCKDDRCQQVEDSLEEVKPGASYSLSVGLGEAFFAVEPVSPGGVLIGSAVAGRPYRCAYLGSRDVVRYSYPVTTLLPCGS
jgi:hypothetical protein